ncbi:hypothetical protein [Sphingobacterium multivorum]
MRQDLKMSYELYKRGAELGSIRGKSNLEIFEKDINQGKYRL